MSNRTTTSQAFRIPDFADAAQPAPRRPLAQDDATRTQLREHYARMITRFSSAAERSSEDAQMAQRRFAKMMTLNTDYALRAALDMLAQHQQLSGTEVAVIVSAAEYGETALDPLRTLLQHPELLPEPAVGAAIRDHLRSTERADLVALSVER